jgi:hypothetical protein
MDMNETIRPMSLLVPRVEGVTGDILDIVKYPQGALLVAPAQPAEMPDGSLVTFIWEGGVSGSSEAWADGVNDVYGLLPADHLIMLVNGPLRIQYIVERFDTPGRRSAVAMAQSESAWLYLRVIDSTQVPLLPPPYVPEAVNDELEPDRLLAHLAIPALTQGSQVQASIDSRQDFRQTLTIRDPAQPPAFTLTRANFIEPNANARAIATYTVTGPGYEARSEPYEFSVGTVQDDLPAPSVEEAPDGTLTPIDAVEGVKVHIPLAAFEPGDMLAVAFGRYTTPGAPPQAGVPVTVPAGEVARHLGETIHVSYSVIRQGSKLISAPFELAIGQFLDGDPNLPPPRIEEATGDTLDLNTFDGDATILVEPWPLIAVGQKVWLAIDGIREDGTHVIRLLDGAPIGSREVISGLQVPVPREQLESLQPQSTIDLRLWVAFDGESDQPSGVLFPSHRYELGTVPPDVFIDLEELPNTSLHTSDSLEVAAGATITCVFGWTRIYRTGTTLAPYCEGVLIELFSANVGGTSVSVRTQAAARYLRFGISAGRLGTVVLYDEADDVIDEFPTPQTSPIIRGHWIEYHAERPIQRVQVIAPAGSIFVDNFTFSNRRQNHSGTLPARTLNPALPQVEGLSSDTLDRTQRGAAPG